MAFSLCHHKSERGAFARYLQYKLQDSSGKKTFIDVDHVIDRDLILSTVCETLDTLVVLLTEKMLGQAWCAGEVTTAVMLEIPVVVLRNADSMVDFGDIQEKIPFVRNFELDGSYLRRRGVTKSLLQD